MKLGEALTIRRRQAEKMADLKGRIVSNALTQEGDEPQEDPRALIEQFDALSKEHAQLVTQINTTNIVTKVVEPDFGVPTGALLDLLAEREHLQRRRAILQAAANAATPSAQGWRFGRQEIKFVAQLPVAELRASAEALSERINALDLRVQEINWNTTLVG